MEDYNEILEEFIEREGFTSIGGDMYKCREGETWHIDDVTDLMAQLFFDLL
jgi:hypothetical protein